MSAYNKPMHATSERTRVHGRRWDSMKHPSPKDIEEMRDRGYEASTIRKAEERSKRWHLAQEVAEHIRNAFSGVTLGQGVGLRQAQGIDGYEGETAIADYRRSDEKENWPRIPPDALNECHSSLSFFDAEGMRFHLPAYLLAEATCADARVYWLSLGV